MIFPRNLINTGILAAVLALTACTSVGERTQLSVGYYTVSGDTFGELDQQILLHGPKVSGVGQALAATNINMVPDVRLELDGTKCKIASARISVRAKVTLPRHAKLRTLKKEIRKAWDNMEAYARLHEEIHVTIADRYAVKIEEAIKAIPPQKNCPLLRERVIKVSDRLLEEHSQMQLQFDKDEQARIRKLIEAGS